MGRPSPSPVATFIPQAGDPELTSEWRNWAEHKQASKCVRGHFSPLLTGYGVASCLSSRLCDFSAVMDCHLESELTETFPPLSDFASGYFITATDMKLEHHWNRNQLLSLKRAKTNLSPMYFPFRRRLSIHPSVSQWQRQQGLQLQHFHVQCTSLMEGTGWWRRWHWTCEQTPHSWGQDHRGTARSEAPSGGPARHAHRTRRDRLGAENRVAFKVFKVFLQQTF